MASQRRFKVCGDGVCAFTAFSAQTAHAAHVSPADSIAVNEKFRAIWEAGGAVSALCHGPSALVNIRLSDGSYLVAGRKVAAFTNAEEYAVGLQDVVPFLLSSTLASRGADMQPAPDWTSQVVVDGRLVTGQNPQSAIAVGEALRDLLLARNLQ